MGGRRGFNEKVAPGQHRPEAEPPSRAQERPWRGATDTFPGRAASGWKGIALNFEPPDSGPQFRTGCQNNLNGFLKAFICFYIKITAWSFKKARKYLIAKKQ